MRNAVAILVGKSDRIA